MITREFNLYLHAGHSIPLVINVNQYDHGEQWLFKLFNSDGTQYVPSSGAIVGIKSDNLGIINSGSVDAQGRVVINETQQMTAAVGKAVFELVIDDGAHGTANFVVLVEPKPGDNADLSETDISMIEQAIEAASTIKPYGSPLVASTVAGMTDHEKVYVYVGSETGYTSGNWYYWDGSAWTSGGVYNSVAVQTDTTLTLSGVAADSKKVGDELNDLKSQIAQSTGMSTEFKVALENLLSKVAYIDDDGQTYLNALHTAMYPPANLTSITAVYTQSGTVYNTDSLDDLKSDLVVTANYDDETSETVTTYTLSGTLTEGTSVITVAYGGKTATFNVTVTHVVSGWYYPFNGSLLSAGTKDFGFTGTENYDTGHDGQCYVHYPDNEDSSLLGIKAIGITDLPDFSGDFTLAFWYKSMTANLTGHPFGNSRRVGNTSKNTLPDATNIASGYTVAKSAIYTSYAGLSVGYISSKLLIRFVTGSTPTGGSKYNVTMPSGFDSTQWHHYAITKSGSTIYVFIDGNVIFTLEGVTDPIYLANQISIGNWFNESNTSNLSEQNTTSYGDYIDDLYIAESCKWSEAFDPSEITY